MKDIDKHKYWTLKDGWEHFKKLVSQSERVNSIQDGLSKLKSKLVITDNMFISDKNRHSQILSSFADGSISVDFWENGICWHTVFLRDVSKVCLALHLWNEVRVNSDKIEIEVPEIQFPLARKKIEKGNQEYVKWHWDNMVKTRKYIIDGEALLFDLLIKDNQINKLMSFDSMWYFGFRKYIGEYGDSLKNNLPIIKMRNDKFHVMTPEMVNLDFKGELTEKITFTDSYKNAYEFLKELLPENLGWAEYQTVEQYDSRIIKSGSQHAI